MVPQILGIEGWEWLIILAIALLLFGGTKLAGLGKASGRAIREFKEETRALDDKKKGVDPEIERLEHEAAEAEKKAAEARAAAEKRRSGDVNHAAEVVDAEIVDQPKQ